MLADALPFPPWLNFRLGMTEYSDSSQSFVSTHLTRISKTWLTVKTLRVGREARYRPIGSRAVRMPDSFALLRQRFYDRWDKLIRMVPDFEMRDRYSHLIPVVVAYTANDVGFIRLELCQFIFRVCREVDEGILGDCWGRVGRTRDHLLKSTCRSSMYLPFDGDLSAVSRG